MNKTIKTFGYPETLVKEYKHWVVLLRPVQVTLGSLVIAAKSDALHLGNLDESQWAEFALISKEMENLLKDSFGAEKFNYFALMMKDPNVHFHFIPRYSKEVVFNEKTFKDTDWPGKSELNPIDLSEGTFKELLNLFIKRLG